MSLTLPSGSSCRRWSLPRRADEPWLSRGRGMLAAVLPASLASSAALAFVGVEGADDLSDSCTLIRRWDAGDTTETAGQNE